MSSFQLESNRTHEAFGEINIERTPTATHVHLTILMEPDIEGMQTGIALDGSASMREAYGKVRKAPPQEVFQSLVDRGLMKPVEKDGTTNYIPTQEAIQELKQGGHWGWSENLMQGQAREMTSYLASNLDEDGGTTVIYWACGSGTDIEILGDFTANETSNIALAGPQNFGGGTHLVPAMRYFIDRFHDANYGLYIFMTDGALDDFEDVKKYTIQLAKEIESGQRKMVKCVLIGVGHEIKREQMEALDDLETGTDVDIWDHKIASEMRGIMDIFAEIVDANMLIAPQGSVHDHNGNIVKQYDNGLPAEIEFSLPADATQFTLTVGDMTVKQVLS
ncbi:MAG: hypothetical protein CL920_23535 [Deltaproteobacteria bacterium]|nr:hypothetical protein [Deltaproteobacteria bacterium]MBU51674.1 hypothetical protein [Deltaproteobacteria bacterium]|tara:strand:+ start:4467 stop:5468 length:1002 start_codon:yes stop_codon:yes gene_type:complete